jgi:hypothetical protein
VYLVLNKPVGTNLGAGDLCGLNLKIDLPRFSNGLKGWVRRGRRT